MNETETKELDRFRGVATDYMHGSRSKWDNGKPHALETKLSSVVIAARHFARGDEAPAAEILRIAAEVTGVPLEKRKDVNGNDVDVWPPARGEVGWLPYDVPPENW